MAQVLGRDLGPEKCFLPSLVANVIPQATAEVAPVLYASPCSRGGVQLLGLHLLLEQLLCVSSR